MDWNQGCVGYREAELEMSKIRGQTDPRIPATGRSFRSRESFQGQLGVSMTHEAW